MIFLIYLFNHIAVTIFRAYLRSRQLRYVNFRNEPEFGSFSKGFQRRILRVSTFVYSAALTLSMYILVLDRMGV